MAIEPILTNFRQELQTISGGSTRQFEEAFAPIHGEWHDSNDDPNVGRGTFQGDFIGFLSFHHEVVLAHQAMRTKNGETVEGEITTTNPPYGEFDDGTSIDIDALTDPQSFSDTIQNWHNGVHHHGTMEFMDPRRNIFMPLFWQFHTFIENKFMAWLNNNNIVYDDVDHTMV
jgi:hypothetical protein